MNASDSPWARPASSGQTDPPAAAPAPPAARHTEAERGPGAGTSRSRDMEPSGHEPANVDGNTAPGRGIQAWACLRLADGTRRLAAIPASPRQASTEPASRAREPELEAEP
jgi:hypothetical protein